VRPTHEGQVAGAVVAAMREGVLVMKLEIVAPGAAQAIAAPVGASAAVARVHQSPHRSGNVPGRATRVSRAGHAGDTSRRGAGVPFGAILVGLLPPAEAPGLDPLQLLADGNVDDPTEVASGTDERMRAFRRSSLSRSSAHAVKRTW
jgi:hypothetical protein